MEENNGVNLAQPKAKKLKKQVTVKWDEEKIQVLENEKQLHPKKKIDEPKTPYIVPEGDDEYSKKLIEINKLQPTEDVLAEVSKRLEERQSSDDNEQENCENKNQFKSKRNQAYKNEFNIAKSLAKNDEEDEEDKEVLEETLKNTLFNKFYGKVNKKDNYSPPTRIELKLEDDIADYEETIDYRKRNLQKNSNNILQAQYPSSPEDFYHGNQKINFLNFNNSDKQCRNFNLEFSSGAMVSPNPHSYTKNLNITKQNIISEFISEEGNEDQGEDDFQVKNFNFGTRGYTPKTPNTGGESQSQYTNSPPDFTMK